MIALSHQPWIADDDAFVTPLGVTACVKLHSVAARSVAGKETPGSLLCILPDDSRLGDSFNVLASGDPRDVRVDSRMLDKFERLLGHRPHGDTLAECIADMLLTGADPLGLDRAKPLLPTVQGRLELMCGGRLWERAFLFGSDPHTNMVQAVLQADFKRHFDADNGRSDAPLKVLDYWCDKYRIRKDDRAEWEKLIPADLRAHVEGPKPHATTITDNFDGADGTTIGNLLTWTEDAGDWTRVSNRSVAPTGATSHAHATTALSGTDHYSQADVAVQGTSNGAADRIAGPTARWANSSNFYFCGLNNVASGTTVRLYERTAGVSAQIGTDETVSVSLPDTLRVTCNGTTQAVAWNGSTLTNPAGTDTSHTTGTLCGIWNRSSSHPAHLDNFEAADLSVAAVVGRGLTDSILTNSRLTGILVG